MNAFTFFESSSNPMPPPVALGWLGTTTLDALPGEIQRRMEEALAEGDRGGYRRGREKTVAEIQSAYQKGLAEAEAKVRAEYEGMLRALERERSEARLAETEERGMLFDRMLKEKEKALEDRIRAELAKETGRGSHDSSIRAVKVSTVQRSGVDSAKLEAARRQGFAEGQEALRRDLEAIKRQSFLEGQEAMRRASFGIEGSRSWALGVMHLPEGCASEDVRQRYRKLSRSLHPDSNPGLEDLFIKNLNRAKDILGD